MYLDDEEEQSVMAIVPAQQGFTIWYECKEEGDKTSLLQGAPIIAFVVIAERDRKGSMEVTSYPVPLVASYEALCEDYFLQTPEGRMFSPSESISGWDSPEDLARYKEYCAIYKGSYTGGEET